MSKLTSFLTFLVATGMCAISVHGAPATNSGATTNNDDIGKMKENAVLMNKTNNEKSLKMVAKSMRPQSYVAMPYYPPPVPLRFQRAPPKYDSFGRPMNSPYVRRPTPTVAYMGYQPSQMYPGYAPLAPVPHRAIPPVFNYQHQPLLPPNYNYAPYAANSYVSYGYRSATEEEKVQPVLIDSSMPTNDQDKTIPERLIYEEPQYSTSEYTQPNMDSTSSQVQPREMFVMGSPNKYDLVDDKISVNYMSPIAEPNDSVFWEMKRPYGYIVRPQTYPEMESPQLSYRFTEPSGNYEVPVQPRQYLIDSSNWALQGGENVPSILIM